MEGRFPFPMGVLICREQGGRVTLHMERRAGEGLYRGWLRGKTGRMDLGTLLPDGDRLCLRRTRLGCWPIMEAGVEMTYSFAQSPPAPPEGWKWEECPGRLFGGDGTLREAAEAAGRCLLRRKEDGFCLAYPWNAKKPFPLVPAFCFGRMERVGERGAWVVFRFGEKGGPEMPEG